MSLEIRTGISGDAQESSFMNATLQSAGDVAFSIAVHIEVPDEITKGLSQAQQEEMVELYLRSALSSLSSQYEVSVEVEIGPNSEPEGDFDETLDT